jgi:amidase
MCHSRVTLCTEGHAMTSLIAAVRCPAWNRLGAMGKIRIGLSLIGLAVSWATSATASGVDMDGVACDTSIAAIEQALSDQGYTVTDLAGYYVRRIGVIDQNGPALHSIVEVNPDWKSLARDMDKELKSRAPSAAQPLFGIPVVLKDNIDTADRMQTTAGSLALLGFSPERDAFIVRRLRAAGALILGKANMSEWAGMRDFNQTAGWAARGGQTRNPYDPSRSPGGSSSGSAVAVAADLTAAAIGTDTGGSISLPASADGVVGIRPTVVLVSRSGIIPISSSYDTAGPLTRTVADAATVLTVISGYDPDDPATARLNGEPPPDFRLALKANSLLGARIGVLREYAHYDRTVVELFDRAIATLRARGAIVIDPVSIPTKGAIDDDFQANGESNNDTEIVQETEFKDGIKRYLVTRHGPGPKDLDGLIDFDNEHAAEEMPYFGQDVFTASQKRGPITDKVYRDALERTRRRAGLEGIDAALGKDHLDALIAPTAGPAAVIDHLYSGVGVDEGHFMMLAAAAGYPRVTVPMGQIHGLPLGITFVGTAWSEFRLIGLAYAFEQAAHARRPPGQGVIQ